MVCTANIVLNGVIRVYHVYKTKQSPFVGETLHLQTTNAGNEHDMSTVTIIKNSVTVGLPRVHIALPRLASMLVSTAPHLLKRHGSCVTTHASI